MVNFVAAGMLLVVSFPALAASDTASSMLTVLLSLGLILGGFVAVAWFARRYLPGMGAQGAVKVVGTTAVGARERVVVVEVDEGAALSAELHCLPLLRAHLSHAGHQLGIRISKLRVKRSEAGSYESKEEVMTVYDLAIVGAGPGGVYAAKWAAKKGLKTILIEKRKDISKITRYCSEHLILDEGYNGDTILVDPKKGTITSSTANGWVVDYKGTLFPCIDK